MDLFAFSLYCSRKKEETMNLLQHHGVRCDGCGMNPLIGARFKCLHCVDFDLCSTCILERRQYHTPQHNFLFIDESMPHLVGIKAPLLTSPLTKELLDTSSSTVDDDFKKMYITFDIDEPNLRVSPTECSKLSQLVTNPNQSEWAQKTFGTSDGRVLDTSVRNTFVWTKGGMAKPIGISWCQCQSAIQQAGDMWCEFQRDAPRPDLIEFSLNTQEILVYNSGCFFKEHEDRDVFNTQQEQLGTLLLIGYSNDAKGGEVRVNDKTVVSYENSNVDSNGSNSFRFKGCIIRHKTRHNVTPLSQGFRFVYKAVIRLKNAKATVYPSRSRTLPPTLFD